MAVLYAEAIRRGWWPAGDAALLDFWALAEKALQEDSRGTPGRLFHALVKSKERVRITDAQEIRAQRRLPSHLRADLARRGVSPPPSVAPPPAPLDPALPSDVDPSGLWALDADRVVYQHSILVMCFFPQKRLSDSQRYYVVRHGRAALSIEAGRLVNPEEVGSFRSLPVPFGSRVRLVLPYINGYALRHRTRTIDLGHSLRAFLSKLGLSFDGRRGRQIMEQVQALAAAHLVLGLWEPASGRAHSHHARIADAMSFWIERDERQRALWEPEMTLSQPYYDAITDRPVPLDMHHLVQLARSPRRMDLYAWLSYRTASIAPGRKITIPLKALLPVFAPDVADLRLFRDRLRTDLQAITAVHPGFRVGFAPGSLVLERSVPPVPRRVSVLLPGSSSSLSSA